MITQTTELSETRLADAVKNNLIELLIRTAERTGADDKRENGFVRWYHPAVPHVWFNGVASTALAAGSEDAAIEEAIAFFQEQGLPTFSWWIRPGAPTEPLEQRLRDHGFQYSAATPGMAMSLTDVVDVLEAPGGFTMARVQDEKMLQVWIRVFIEGYGLPPAWETGYRDLTAGLGFDGPMRSFIGYLDGEPVTAASWFQGTDAAGVYNIATLPHARRRGLGALMTQACLLDARREGYALAVLQSSELGFRVYEHLGFKQVSNLDFYYYSAQ